jgi:glyoxylase-like metal-dependent hydrolase (beta-lactamase superfamily II)
MMQIYSFTAGPWQTNCYIVAPSDGSECLIIDPGMKAASQVRDVVAEHKLKPVAVLVTHGHIDHMWSVFPVASGYGVPALIHGSDRHLLADPGFAISAETRAALPTMMGSEDVFAEPEDVREVTDNMSLAIAGFDITIRHAPGHTAGSVLFDFDGSNKDSQRNIFTGDVLFAGAIGRTDLPSGSPEEMNASLRNVVLSLEDNSRILPGHGPSSFMNIERETNPYLLRIAQGLSAT